MAVQHHELCFGCGNSNLFGLHIEADTSGEKGLAAEFVVRDEHTGASGYAHTGVLSGALYEVMALSLPAEGVHGRAEHVEVDFHESVPRGSVIELTTTVGRSGEGRIRLHATACRNNAMIASGQGDFVVSTAP